MAAVAWVAVALLAWAGPATAAPMLLGTVGAGGTGSTLVEIDPATGGLVRVIGPVGYTVNGLTYDATSGTLYGGTSYHDPIYNGLITIDMDTGVGTPVGANWWGGGWSGPVAITNTTADSAGRLSGWSEWEDGLVRIDKATGVASLVGYSGIGTAAYGMAFDAADTLWLVNYDGSCLSIDTATGVASYVSSIGTTAHHGDFDPETGLYYGISSTGNPAPWSWPTSPRAWWSTCCQPSTASTR